MYNVFIDFHHASLLNSIIMLFEGRLGGNVYRPIGMEWADKGFWALADHPATKAQFLGMEQGYRPLDNTPPLNNYQLREGIYYCQDIDSGKYNKAITFEGFLNQHIDIIIATIPQHTEPYYALAQLHPDKPKLIYQIGNNWNIATSSPIKNIMASTRLAYKPDGFNIVEYHQEFDTNVFYPHFPHEEFSGEAHCKCLFHSPANHITSFVNCFNVDGLFAADWALFQEMERLMPDWKFNSFGGQCRDGAAHGGADLADKMRGSKFIWHTKQGGDGYGHIIHNAAAVARPLIVKKGYYDGKLGADLMIDGQTCLNIDGLGPEAIVQKIRYFSQPEQYQEMCRKVHENFRRVVDFDREFEQIKLFLGKLL